MLLVGMMFCSELRPMSTIRSNPACHRMCSTILLKREDKADLLIGESDTESRTQFFQRLRFLRRETKPRLMHSR